MVVFDVRARGERCRYQPRDGPVPGAPVVEEEAPRGYRVNGRIVSTAWKDLGGGIERAIVSVSGGTTLIWQMSRRSWPSTMLTSRESPSNVVPRVPVALQSSR